MFSFEFCKVLKSTYFAEYLRTAASERVTTFKEFLPSAKSFYFQRCNTFEAFYFKSVVAFKNILLQRVTYPSRHTTSFQRLYDVYTTSATSYRRRIDVETTSCVYWVITYTELLLSEFINPIRSQLQNKQTIF